MGRVSLLIGLLVLAVAGPGLARTWYVNPDGSGDAATIQAAVDSAVAGDDIVLANGVYAGPGNYGIVIPGRQVSIHSDGGDPYACVIDCQRLGNGFTVKAQGSKLTLEGVTIRNGRGSEGAVSSAKSVAVRNCVFDGNATAVYLLSAGSFTDCVFVNNTDGAVYACSMSTVTFTGCSFLDNSTTRYWAAVTLETWTDGVFTNCTFSRNDYVIDFTRSGVKMYNCTLYDNYGCCVICETCQWDENEYHYVRLVNTIIAHNAGAAVACVESWCGDSYLDIRCCDIYGNGQNWGGCLYEYRGVNGNFSECPSFCRAEIGDLHLCDGSPCLPGNHPTGYDCGLIGAWGQGCACGPSETTPSTWGAIKAIYK